MRMRLSCSATILCHALGLVGCALDGEAPKIEGAVGSPDGARAEPGGDLRVAGARLASADAGAASVWGPAQKSFLGTSASERSRVYFTGYRGIVSEVFYPVLDTVNTVDLQFLVGDTARTFVDEEKLQRYTVSQPDKRSMRWQATTSNLQHNWRLIKSIFTDPGRNALILRVTFEALGGRDVRQFNLYLLHNPAMDNSGGGDTSRTLARGGRTMLVASQNQRASALSVSRPWKLDPGNAPMVSNGFVGVSDGWTDLLGGSADKTMDLRIDVAENGNVAQMGWIDLGDSPATSVSFDVVLAARSVQVRERARDGRRHRDRDVGGALPCGAARVRHRQHGGPGQLEHRSRRPARPGELSGVEEPRQPAEEQRGRVQVLPQEPRRQRDLGASPGRRQPRLEHPRRRRGRPR